MSTHSRMSIPVSAAVQNRQLAENLKDVRHTILVMSGKGGVGKSSVAANLAAALADRGCRVGLLDVDLHGPSLPRLLGAEGGIMSQDGMMLPAPCGERLCLLSMDLLLKDRDAAVLWRGPMKTGVIRQFLTEVRWGALDYLVIDSPPGTGDEPMAVLESLPQASCLVVTTPQELSLADVRKALDFLHTVKARVLGLVENMSGLICPHCGGAIDLFRSGGGERLAAERGLPFLGAIPLDPAAVVAADQGVPLVRQKGDSPAKAAFLTLADAVLAATPSTERGES